MTADEAVVLLTHLTNLDNRHGSATGDLAAAKATSWALVLEAVPLEDALRAATRLYSAPRVRLVTAGDLLDVWRHEQRELSRVHESGRYAAGQRPDESYAGGDTRVEARLRSMEADPDVAPVVAEARSVLGEVWPQPLSAGRIVREVLQTLADPS